MSPIVSVHYGLTLEEGVRKKSKAYIVSEEFRIGLNNKSSVDP